MVSKGMEYGVDYGLSQCHGFESESKGMEYGVDYGLSQCHGFESESIPSWTSDSM